MATANELRAFMRGKRMVRFERRFEPNFITGYVVDVAADLFLLLHVDDSIRFNGFQVCRNRDVRRLRAEPRADFIQTVLRRRRDRRPVKPRLRLDDFSEVLRSAARHVPLVTIHRESVDPGVCHIGAVVEVGERRVVLREIGTDGTWDPCLEEYALREITRVDFGGAYEDALLIVGGRPPRDDKMQQPKSAPRGNVGRVGSARPVSRRSERQGSRR
jgi:hypothetical protein